MIFTLKNGQFLRNGQPIQLISGAVHYFRNMPDTWGDIFCKLRAMGCNCVETYCAWNRHEPTPGQYDFSGILDVAAFIRLAADHGLMVILRPGPYICSEWEFGGLPWWLLQENDLEIRCSNPAYLAHVDRYLDHLFDQVRPLLCTQGGPVIMVQCENEYGYYGDDKAYMAYLRDGFRRRGIDVPLFTSDGYAAGHLLDGTVEGCLPTLNFANQVEEKFVEHDRLFPDVPKMCMELWDGWFDAWGDAAHHTTSPEEYAAALDAMLNKGSVNIYMFIGGTNFGFMAGANHSALYTPDVTSYDYDAPLTEWGDITPKYLALREVIRRHTGADLPPIPPNREKRAYGRVPMNESVGLFRSLPLLAEPIHTQVPRSMEQHGIGYGYIAYRTVLTRAYKDAPLSFTDLGDRAHIFIDDTPVDILYKNDRLETRITAPAGATLTVLCENMGRVNFGPHMMDQKGIVGRCLLDNKIHFGWDVYRLPMDDLTALPFTPFAGEATEKAAFYRGFVTVDQPRDTFLRADAFTKGFVTINGFSIGRYWDIGPQRTLYVPASLLRPGRNEIMLFESDGLKEAPEIVLCDTPLLDGNSSPNERVTL